MIPLDLDQEQDNNPPKRKILLYGDVNLNILDGSAIWLVSMAECLSLTESFVTVLLKAQVTNDRLVARLRALPNVVVEQKFEDKLGATEDGESLTPRLAAQALVHLDSLNRYDAVVARGRNIVANLANSGKLTGRLWPYITDLPELESDITPELRAQLEKIVANARRVFAQTEASRAHLESVLPTATGKVVLLNPMIPDELFEQRPNTKAPERAEGLKLVYSGKFAKDWKTLEMCALPARLNVVGPEVSLSLVGDKFQADKTDSEWAAKMKAAAEDSPGVSWLGGLSREEALRHVRRHDVGLSWRSESLDASLEISTKVLEYAAVGVPPLVNRNSAHVEIFGDQYPLYVDGDPERILSKVADNRALLDQARHIAREAVRSYSMASSSRRLERYFSRSEADYSVVKRSSAVTKVVLAGHDLKFAGELIDLLSSRADIDLRIDKWPSLHINNPDETKRMLDWADVILCEWAGPNAVLYSREKRSHQKLIVRLHAFELNGPWLQNIDFAAIDHLVCVSELYKRNTLEKVGIEPSSIQVIPNGIDCDDFDRPKSEGFERRLGMVGIVPIKKRPDRALDVLEMVLQNHEDVTLHIKGRMPWEYPWEWNKIPQREMYREFYNRIGRSDLLRERVIFEPFGADMGNWLRKIGFMLSPSSYESFHLAPAEGMASSAVPVFWQRPGVDEIFGKNWTFSNSEEAAEFITSCISNRSLFNDSRGAAQKYASKFDTRMIGQEWLKLIFAEGSR
ncbi:glycosyltransferase [Paenarthrobacter ureafaciens]|uniref:glycosyltransferase n=1 Tax=Paenarthrobacter ureafaciens TaxID=37931 RepID=UPI0009AF02E5|nr:glycosyltransferase [Paenarthrobacter ureafaciens]GLU59558.1 glycosyl transferase [Paenarthrobacter ureafaciens]GLU63707.1 glycosyl transferase [Paenarthrobacter ureafaciens]GLU68100.1 glycosyl transferase [Paenarthrobacter ureafaciens]GLU72243.1 glycosyl transferase [Paenarthrobacter ureafaciens]GLU76512.1 glycosyl transferase [Paenarthrobacter ureafaciens]